MKHSEKLNLAEKMLQFQIDILQSKIDLFHDLKAKPEEEYTDSDHKILEGLMGN